MVAPLTCPACHEPLAQGQTSCPACGSLTSPPVEGALAPDPRSGRAKVEPLREIPGLRKRERTWKDEVRERVRQRRQERTGIELPLFPDDEPDSFEADPEAADSEEPPGVPHPVELAAELDLPLRSSPASGGGAPARDSQTPAGPIRLGDQDRPAAPSPPTRPVERPARLLERAQAAILDLGLLLGLWALVVYFASRAARVGIGGLLPSWPWLVAYLAGLGLVYAAYFSGVTGQTLGKLALGLRVVDSSGQPPGALRALARALLGSLAVAMAFTGLLPVLLDPAKRAVHDRLLRTRVIKG